MPKKPKPKEKQIRIEEIQALVNHFIGDFDVEDLVNDLAQKRDGSYVYVGDVGDVGEADDADDDGEASASEEEDEDDGEVTDVSTEEETEEETVSGTDASAKPKSLRSRFITPKSKRTQTKADTTETTNDQLPVNPFGDNRTSL